MKKVLKMASCFIVAIAAMFSVSMCVFAEGESSAEAASAEVMAVQEEETDEADSTGDKALAAGIALGLAALGGAIGMGFATGKSNEAISRQPEAEGKIRTSLMLGFVFIETAIIYALVIAILIIFVL